jgi:hypothetical protein
MSRTWIITVLLGALIALAGCADPSQQAGRTDSVALAAIDSPTPIGTRTAIPTATPLIRTATPAQSSTPTLTPSITPTPSDTPTPTLTPTITPTPTTWPATFEDMPVIPTVSQTAIDIYRHGMALGRDPHSFALIGDCNSQTVYYLTPFSDPAQYRLGPYASLQATIDYFKGSFDAPRPAARNGFNAATVISKLWTDPNLCQVDETPLECEFRLKNPSIAIISLGTNFSGLDTGPQHEYLSEIVQYLIDRGVVPILGTKADNLEGDNSINAMIYSVAREYDVPLWNFWAAVQGLPDQGLTLSDSGTLYDLTFAQSFFDDPARMQMGWPVRNLTALQALDAVWRGVSQASP